jgi:hypothetical protein
MGGMAETASTWRDHVHVRMTGIIPVMGVRSTGARLLWSVEHGAFDGLCWVNPRTIPCPVGVKCRLAEQAAVTAGVPQISRRLYCIAQVGRGRPDSDVTAWKVSDRLRRATFVAGDGPATSPRLPSRMEAALPRNHPSRCYRHRDPLCKAPWYGISAMARNHKQAARRPLAPGSKCGPS